MPTANEAILNSAVHHQIGLIRYGTTTTRQVVSLLNASQARVLEQISKYGAADSPERLNALLASIRAIDIEAALVLSDSLDGSLAELSVAEADYVAESVNKHISDLPIHMNIATPTSESLYAAIHSRPFEGRILSDYYKDLPDTIMRPVQQTLRQGFAEGRTTDQIIRELRGSKAVNYTDGILQQPRNSVERLVRTAINHTATTSREEVYKNNDDVISSVRWVSTLDMRTSDICQALDGQIFEMGVGPRPPAHFNCRSTTSPIVKSWKEMGFDIDELPEGTRASLDGQVPASETYQTWLSKQPANVQDDVLGPTRAALFREGGLTLDKFVDSAGNSLTLDQLRKREADAFGKIA